MAAPVFHMRGSQMKELMRYAAALEGEAHRPAPPIDKWDPPLSGDIDIVIKRDGSWLHEGAPITRAHLVRLFSTILKREGDDYFLVTPVEKYRIMVEDAPFLAIDIAVDGAGEDRSLTFTTNLHDKVTAGPTNPLRFETVLETGECRPYVEVRAGLDALIARSVYYDLVALAEERHLKNGCEVGVWSGGSFFPIGAPADEIS